MALLLGVELVRNRVGTSLHARILSIAAKLQNQIWAMAACPGRRCSGNERPCADMAVLVRLAASHHQANITARREAHPGGCDLHSLPGRLKITGPCVTVGPPRSVRVEAVPAPSTLLRPAPGPGGVGSAPAESEWFHLLRQEFEPVSEGPRSPRDRRFCPEPTEVATPGGSCSGAGVHSRTRPAGIPPLEKRRGSSSLPPRPVLRG